MGNKQSGAVLPVSSPGDSAHTNDSVILTYEQARDLLAVLDSTRRAVECQLQRRGGGGKAGSWWSVHCFPAKRRWIATYILVLTVVLQSINLAVVSIIDIWPRWEERNVVDATGYTMIFLQLINLFFIIMVSVRLVKQLKKHKVSVLLLGQAYISNLLLFAGFYTLTYRLQPKSWKFIQEELSQDPVLVIVLYSKFLFFSVSTATLCGSDNVLPQEWYNCLFTAIQMLMSFVYFASILGQTMSQDTQFWLGVGSGKPGPPSKEGKSIKDQRHSVLGGGDRPWREVTTGTNVPPAETVSTVRFSINGVADDREA